jgi:hypothetical protein
VRNLPGAGPRTLTVATDPAQPPDRQPQWTLAGEPPGVVISPEGARELSLNGQRYWVEVPSDPKEVKVSLRSAASSQSILTVKTELPPDDYFNSDCALSVLWAGDLDGDDKLDLVLWESSAHDGVFRLYLSTAARPGDLVGEVGLLFE